MEEGKSGKWSSEDEKLLHHETLIAEVLRRRGLWDDKEGQKKSFLLRFLDSNGGTALITVLLGGLLGQMISCSIQRQLKDRELQQAFIKARGDQALVGYKEYIDQEQQLVKHAYDLIGNSVSASENLIELTTPEFDPRQYVGEDRETIKKQRESYRRGFNEADEQWQREKEDLGLLMMYYHQGRSGVIASWRSVQDALQKYSDCAQQWYRKQRAPTQAPNDVCRNEKTDFRNKLDQLTGSLQSSRRYVWEGWESINNLQADMQK
jgi:hypothetical protein